MTDAQYNGIVNFHQRADVIDAWRQLVAGKGARGGAVPANGAVISVG